MCKGIVVYFPLNRNSYERFFPIRDTLSMVQKKAAWNGQGDRQSKVVEQFASGFVATSSATEAEKSAQRDWDRSKLLAVNADDPQSAIYEQISVRSNMSAEGGTTRRGLGCGADSGSTSAHAQYRRGVSFVSAGGAPAPLFVPKSGVASTPASGMPHQAPGDQGSLPQGSLPQGSLPQGSLPQGWVSAQAPTGALYYVNTSTGVTQWEPPTALPPLPPGWVEGRDPNSGIAYYANPSTGQTQWERPAAQLPPSAPPPPPLPPPPSAPPAPPAPPPAAPHYATCTEYCTLGGDCTDGDRHVLLGGGSRLVKCLFDGIRGVDYVAVSDALGTARATDANGCPGRSHTSPFCPHFTAHSSLQVTPVRLFDLTPHVSADACFGSRWSPGRRTRLCLSSALSVGWSASAER